MKKGLIILATVAFALVACNREPLDNTQVIDETSATGITFDLSANHPDDNGTKAVKTGWEDGDVIYVFFNNVAAPRYLRMSYSSAAGTWTYTQMNGASEESLGLSDGASGSMRAIYFPFCNDATVYADGSLFKFSKTTYSYYLTATLGYTVSGGTVSGAFNMQIPDGYVQFFLDDASADPDHEIELREPHLTPQGIAWISSNGYITHTTTANIVATGSPLKGYVYDKEVKGEGESKGYLFSGILASEARNAPTTYHFTLVSGGWLGSYYAKSFENRTWYRSASAGRALKIPALSNWAEITDYKPIDLGCDVRIDQYGTATKRVYWCSRNIGASADGPADSNTTYGDYYAWGETAPYYKAENKYEDYYSYYPEDWPDGKTGYNWETYQYETAGDGSKFSKYTATEDSYATSGTADGLSILEPSDDVAHAILGGYWRIPTAWEWTMLINNTLGLTRTNDSSNKGFIVRNNTSGSTIFLPAAGMREGTHFYNYGYGYYWSSELYSEEDYSSPSYPYPVITYPNIAQWVYFSYDYPVFQWGRREQYHPEDQTSRYAGMSIRAVTE